jgi:putative endonuclease
MTSTPQGQDLAPPATDSPIAGSGGGSSPLERGTAARKPGRNQILGRQGEELAAALLEAAGLVIVARNVRTRHGEIDIVARDGRILVFIEVKTRSSTRFGTGAEAIDPRKQARMRRLASSYLGRTLDRTPLRFDVVDVLMAFDGTSRINHIRGAF